MSRLLKEIKKISEDAARVLECADLRTDSDIQSLTREELRDLFPEPRKLKLRRQILEIIHKQKPINLLLQEMKAFIPDESFRAAVTENGVLAEYLKILKDTKTQLNNVQAFLDAHIDLLESISKNPPDLKPHRGFRESHPSNYQTESLPRTSISPTCGPVEFYKAPNPAYLQVKCGILVTGKTFNAHEQILDKVKNISDPNSNLVYFNVEENPSDQDYQVIIVFCPITSRVGTDVEAAMRQVTGDKPIILVIMEHKHEATSVSPLKAWDDDSRVVLHVHVFFHERKHGLLQCDQNNEAVAQVQKKLLQYSVKISGNSQDRTRKTSKSSGDTNDDSSGIMSRLFNRW